MFKKISFSVFIICVLFSITNCKIVQKPIVEAAEEIPYFTFTTLDNKRFVKDNLDTTRTKLFYYFNSECEHCEKQGSWLSKDIELFDDLEIVFISFEEMDAIESYKSKYNFTKDNITFLQDTRLTFSDKFGVGEFPSIILYTKEGKLIKKFEGETKVSEIVAFIK
jgi:thioredoxin-related protein